MAFKESSAADRKPRPQRLSMRDFRMRILLPVLIVVALAGCSSTDDPQPEAGQDSPTSASTTTGSSETPANTSEACDLLETAEAEELLGEPVGDGKPGLTGGTPNCQWAAANDHWLQVITVDASTWAQSLPEILRQVEASGQFDDPANLQKLQQAAALIEDGEVLDPTEACSLFSEMLELQGQPPGSSMIVTVIPTRAQRQGVSGQMCSDGRFTSVLLADTAGLQGPLPIPAVAETTRLVHRRSMG